MDAIAAIGSSGVSRYARAAALAGVLLAGALRAGETGAGEAPAPVAVVREIDVPELKALMQREGYAVETDEDGDLVWKIDGFRALLQVDKKKTAIHFRASFADSAATMARVNAWNKTKVYSRSYLDDDNDPVLELDLDLEGGVTTARILDFLKTCRDSFGPWRSEVVK